MIRNASKVFLNKYVRRGLYRGVSSSAVVQSSNNEYDMGKFFTHSTDEGFVRKSSFTPVEMPNKRIDQFVWSNYLKWQDKIALVSGESGRQYTYAQLRDHCAALAIRLQQPQFNLHHGDVIALCLPNSPEFAVAALGAFESGLVITTVNPLYTPDEIVKQLISCKAKLLIGSVEGYAVLQAAVDRLPEPIKIISLKSSADQSIPAGTIDFEDLMSTSGVNFGDLKTYETDPNALAFLPYSSGTTGLSKGVMLSHNNITTNCVQINANIPNSPLVDPTTADFQDVLPDVLPFFHIYGFTVLMVSKLALGTKNISLSRFNPQTFLESLVKHRATVVHLVPPIINFLTSHPMVEAKHLSSIRSVMSGAAPIGASDVERFLKKAGRPIDVLQGYGLTETSPVVLMNVKGTTRYGSVGGLTPNTEAKITDLDDTEYKGLPANKSGELVVRGPQAMLGYYQNPEATAEMVMKNGWVRTGDVGHYDEQGYFYITDRLKELIKVKGFQVPPAELEAILRDHPKILDAAVVGAPHAVNGEVPRAFVVKHEGVEVTEKELQDYVADKVASYKRLEGGVRFLPSIPKNSTGKIMRRQIKEEHC